MLFYIPSCTTLAQKIDLPKGSCTIEQFADGEWHVQVHDDVHNKSVWVLAQTGQPADTIIQLLLLCDALQRAGAKLNLMISYFGYARQDKAQQGEALGSAVMCKLVELFSPERVEVVQLHNPEICSFDRISQLGASGSSIETIGTPFVPTEQSEWRDTNKSILHDHIPYDFFYNCVQDAQVIVAPDKGAQEFAQHIADHINKALAVVEKQRVDPQTVTMHFTGEVKDKNVLIVDDMISTGGTIIRAAQLLHEHGAKTIRVAATHGVFAGDALEKLAASVIEHIYVTNTLTQKERQATVTVVDIGPFITKIMQR